MPAAILTWASVHLHRWSQASSQHISPLCLQVGPSALGELGISTYTLVPLDKVDLSLVSVLYTQVRRGGGGAGGGSGGNGAGQRGAGCTAVCCPTWGVVEAMLRPHARPPLVPHDSQLPHSPIPAAPCPARATTPL